MNRLLMACLLSACLTLPVLGNEKANHPSTPAPIAHPAQAPKTEAHKEAPKGEEAKDHKTADTHPKTKEEKKAERKAAREEEKAKHMEDAAKKCSDSIKEAEDLTKDMADGEGKDMVNLFIAHAKLEATALENKNMKGHWHQHMRKCKSYIKKAHAQAKKHAHDKKSAEASTPKPTEPSKTPEPSAAPKK